MRRTIAGYCVAVWALGLMCSEAQALARGDVVFQADFEGRTAMDRWWGNKNPGAGFEGGQSLHVRRDDPAGASVATVVLPVEKVRGCTLYCSAMVRAEDVSAKPRPWNGIKVMMPIESPGGKSWPQADIGAGTFAWRKVEFAAKVPRDATAVTLCLGLESVSGKVWFDEVKVVVGKAPSASRARPTTGPAFKGHDLPRLRGAMVAPNVDEEGLRVLGRDWGANLIRWQLIRYVPVGGETTLQEYDGWLEGELRKLDRAIPWCRRYGLLVAVDLHSPPGGKRTISGYIGSDDRLFTERACQDKFVEVWRRIADRYKGESVVWGYDLANEPVEGVVPEECDDWHGLAQRAGKAIREIDTSKAIIVEPSDWGSPDALADFEPIDVPGVVYSVHMYVPGQFTHQGLYGAAEGVVYPGEIAGQRWDRAALQQALRPVVEFQKQWGVHIYIGEFSAIRWAPDNSAYRYLKDVIDLFEANGWDWSYHAFREWQGWSVEHSEQRDETGPARQETDRQKLLRRWFEQNRKPGQRAG